MGNTFWINFYNVIVVPIFFVLLKLTALISPKIKTALQERKNLFIDLKNSINILDKQKINLWFHSSSVGEFEQAKPIIEKLIASRKFNIITSFLSPSGFKSAKRYEFSDLVTYYPFDSLKNIKQFIDLIDPPALILMRYDIWPNSVYEMTRRKKPVILVDATMKKNSPRKYPIIKKFHKHLFSHFTRIFTISEDDKNEFLSFGIEESKLKVAGDTRYDRVFQKSQSSSTQKIINEKIIEGKKIFVAGSTWKEDEEILLPVIIKLHQRDQNLLSIVVPHEPTIQNLEQIEYELRSKITSIRFSRLNQYNNEKIIIVDSIGILLILYSYAHVAFVGGGFKSNIHNILEPAVYGIPVIFGPKYSNSQEAFKFLEAQAGFSVKNKREMYRYLRKILINENFRIKTGTNAQNFVISNTGATDRIVNELIQIIKS